MAWEKAAYWMAVGAMAFTAGDSVVNRHRDWAGELANRSLQVANQVSGRAMALVTLAEMTTVQGDSRFARVQTKLACAQTKLASLDVVMAREQAGLAKLAEQRVRLADVEQLRSRLICPRSGPVRVLPQPRPMPNRGEI